MTDNIMVGAIGYVIVLTLTDDGLPANISSATTKQIIIQKPDGTVSTKTAAFTTNGSDGKLQYTTILNDIDLSGRYRIQASIVTPSYTGRTTIAEFTAGKNL